jgi:1-acyl-sn-glycerol-3-phosphate acyltransferase
MEVDMLRTIWWFIHFWWYLLVRYPMQRHAMRLDREGRVAERDTLVARVTREWAQAMVRAGGGTVEISGNELIPPEGPLVFIANHQGNYDIPIMIGYVGRAKALISKIEVLKLPFIRTWMKLMQCRFLDRKNLRQSAGVIAEAVEVVRQGYPMVIFPEGTRSKSDRMGPFKHGSFRLAFQSGAPIVPVTIDGSWRLMEQQGRMKPGTVRVTVHPPIPTAGLSKEEQAALPDTVRTIIATALPGQMDMPA